MTRNNVKPGGSPVSGQYGNSGMNQKNKVSGKPADRCPKAPSTSYDTGRKFWQRLGIWAFDHD